MGSSILWAEDSVDTNPIVINDPGSIVANATLSTYPGCVGGGQITVEMEARPYMRNTRANYTLKLYDITSGAPGTQLGTTQTATGTSAHTVLFTGIPRPTAQTKYRVEIMDNGGTAGCEAVTNTLILEPVESLKVEFATTGLTTHLACYGATYGKLIANATGGKNDEPYSYTLNLVSGGQLPSGYVTTNATGIFDGLPAGVYSVTVSQATGGCTPATTSNPATKTITEEPKYTATYEITQVKCQGEANGVFEVKDIRTSQKNYLLLIPFTVSYSSVWGVLRKTFVSLRSRKDIKQKCELRMIRLSGFCLQRMKRRHVVPFYFLRLPSDRRIEAFIMGRIFQRTASLCLKTWRRNPLLECIFIRKEQPITQK